MKTRFVVLALLGVACGLTGCQPPVSAPETRSPSIVPPADGFSLHAYQVEKHDGSGSFALSALQGQPVLAYYYAPWSYSSRDFPSDLVALLAGELRVLPVVVDRQPDGPGEAVKLPSNPSILPAVMAGEDLLKLAGGIRALPTVVLFDAEGKAIKAWPGHVPPETVLTEVTSALR